MRHAHAIGLGLAVGIGLSAVTMLRAGPLDPPLGPVTDTSPSLADLEAQLGALSAGLASQGIGPGFGPFQSIVVNPNDLVTGVNVEVLPQDVFLRSVIVNAGNVAIVDGSLNDIAEVSAASVINNQFLVGGVQFDLNLAIDGPLRLRRQTNGTIGITLIYAEVLQP